MTRPKNAERLREGTRKIWARKLKEYRCELRLTVAEVAGARVPESAPRLAATTLRRYERSGPPTLTRARNAQFALTSAAFAVKGGIQEDLELLLRRKPVRPEVRT
jgi:hypothetical protein